VPSIYRKLGVASRSRLTGYVVAERSRDLSLPD
jgi:hypothetical protein